MSSVGIHFFRHTRSALLAYNKYYYWHCSVVVQHPALLGDTDGGVCVGYYVLLCVGFVCRCEGVIIIIDIYYVVWGYDEKLAL